MINKINELNEFVLHEECFDTKKGENELPSQLIVDHHLT